jgi:DNA helicase HerA-like ATPase
MSASQYPIAAPELVTSDFSAQDTPIPTVFTLVGRVVFWNSTPSFGNLGALLEAGIEVRPGQFLGVWHGRRQKQLLTVLQVGDCHEVNPNEEPQLAAARDRLGLSRGYAGEAVSTRIYRLAACDTVEEFEVAVTDTSVSIVNTRAPETLARAGDPVVLLPDDLAQAAIGSLPNADDGVNLGQSYGASDFPITLVPQILQMHIGVFGNPGKGKSYLSGVIVEEARAWDVPILALDINGEFIDAARALGGLVITLPDPANFGLSLNLLTPPELVSIAPNVQPNTNYAELIELAHDQLRNEARGKNISFDELRSRINDLGKRLETRASSIGAAVSRITVLERDPLIGTGRSFDFIANLIRHRIVVLDCRYLSLRQTQLIAAAAARTLQRHGREMTKRANENPTDLDAVSWFSMLFVDEAHAVAPNSEGVISSQVLYELARMGRHVRTGLVLSSQSPADLDRSILKKLQTRFIFALERDQLSAIGGVSADLGPELQAQLPKLPRGVCAVSGTSELVKHGFLLRVKRRSTPVGGKTPPVFQSRAKRSR